MIGCGFDTRAYRLDGGRWVEVDEPELLAIKEARLPAAEALSPPRARPDPVPRGVARGDAHAVRDGRVRRDRPGRNPRLHPDPDRRALLATLVRLFPHHAVVCDLLTRTFLARYARSLVRFLREIDAEFACVRPSRGAVPRARLPHGGPVSVPERAAELGAQARRRAGSSGSCPASGTVTASGSSSTGSRRRAVRYTRREARYPRGTGARNDRQRGRHRGARARRKRDERAAPRARSRARDGDADLVLLCVPDRAIAEVAAGIERGPGSRTRAAGRRSPRSGRTSGGSPSIRCRRSRATAVRSSSTEPGPP